MAKERKMRGNTETRCGTLPKAGIGRSRRSHTLVCYPKDYIGNSHAARCYISCFLGEQTSFNLQFWVPQPA